MCIAAFVWQAVPEYPFLLLLNRDEYHNRPTKVLGWWEDEEILGGRDEVGGGTWLATSKGGKVAFVTNVLELYTDPDAKSRGQLPVRFLKSAKSPKEFAEMIAVEAQEYNGFNLILADLKTKSMVYISNRPNGNSVRTQEVSPGLHVLTNGALDSPWPKAERLKLNFKKLLQKGEVVVKEMVDLLMRDTMKVDISSLPHICSQEWECCLRSIFVEVDTPLGLFGTRSTAALTASATGEVSFYEKYLEEKVWKDKAFNYCIGKLGHVKHAIFN